MTASDASPFPHGMPFALPDRPVVTRIRQTDALRLRSPKGSRTQPLRGFEATYADIVDYIVRITEEIWVDRGIGRIYDTYDHACTIYSQYGVIRSVEEVVASTAATLVGFPDGELHHLNVAWTGDEDAGFYTSHLGFSRSTNLGPSAYGPATGRRIGIRFAADCISWQNLIHTEWLVRDNGAMIRQLGLDLQDVARRAAETPTAEIQIVSPATRLLGQAPRAPLDLDTTTVEGWVRVMFDQLWNQRRLDRLDRFYATDAVVHSGGGRVATGLRNISTLILTVIAAAPDGNVQVDHVSWSEETDGVIVAARWRLEGTSRRGGVLGDCPEGRTVMMMGVSHMRFAGDRIVEEWTVFDEVGVLTGIYRQ